MADWLITKDTITGEGLRVIEVKCPFCGYKETYHPHLLKDDIKRCYVCGAVLEYRRDI